MKHILIAAALSLTAPFAFADDLDLSKPLTGGFLSAGAVDMSVYYDQMDDGTMQVTATYAPRDFSTQPSRLVMRLNDGDTITFGLPEYRGTKYSFERVAGDLTVTAQPTYIQLASN